MNTFRKQNLKPFEKDVCFKQFIVGVLNCNVSSCMSKGRKSNKNENYAY